MNDIYADLSVFDALILIEKGEIIVPDFQRDYCWTTEDITKLYLSIIEDFPIGSFIFWKPKGEFLNRCSSNFYKMLTEVYKTKQGFVKNLTVNQLCDKTFEETTKHSVVLDGQQRLTSFFLSLKGHYYVKKNKGYDNNPSNYVEKNLYFNLVNDSNETNPFCFLTNEEALEGHYFLIKDILRFSGNPQSGKYNFRKFVEEKISETPAGKNQSALDKLTILYERLSEESQNKSLVHYFLIDKESYDDALDIFVRVNSTGQKLNKTDLIFGKLIDKWDSPNSSKGGKRKEIENYLRKINNNYGFNFTKDFLLRAAILIANNGKSGLSMEAISKSDTIQQIRSNWPSITGCIDKTAKIMKEIGLSDERILAYNAIMPIIYYFSLKGTAKKDKDKNELRKYFAVSFSKRIFGASSDSIITNVCQIIKNNIKKYHSFNMHIFDTFSSGGKSFKVNVKDDINYWIEHFNKGPKTYPFLMLLSPSLDLSHNIFDQDHSHADALFNDKNLEALGLQPDKIQLWKEKRNHIPNLSFMDSSWNRSKSKTDLSTWIKNNPDKVSSLVFLPKNTSFELKDFETFYIRRRSMIKYYLVKQLNAVKDEVKIDSEVTLNENISPKQDSNLSHTLEYGMHGVVKKFLDLTNTLNGALQKYALVSILDDLNNIVFDEYVPESSLYVIEQFDAQI